MSRLIIHVAHPGTQRGFRVARVLAECGCLGTFSTTLAFEPDACLGVRYPSRALTGIPVGRVRRFLSWMEWVNVFGSRLPCYDSWKQKWWIARNQAFGSRVGRRVGSPGEILYGFDSSSAEMFMEGRQRGLKCVLDQSTVHVVRARGIIESAIQKRPEYARSIQQLMHSAAEIQRRCREVQMADLVLCPSETVKASVLEAGGEDRRIAVVPFGIDLACFTVAPLPPMTPFRFLFVGDVTQLKGAGCLFEAWRRAKLEGAELWVVGVLPDGFDWRPHLSPGIRFVGRVSRERLAELYHASHCLVLPTLLEGQANAVMEAMACGRCVITTPACGLGNRLINGVNGVVLEADAIEELSRVLRRLTADPAGVQRMGLAAAEAAREFSLAAYGERLLDVLRRLSEAVVP